LRDFALVDRCDALLFTLAPERVPILRDLVADLFAGVDLPIRFEPAFAVFTILRAAFFAAGAIRRPLAAFAASAPATPPTTAPIGPAMLPTAAPATAAAVCFGIGGTSILSDGREVCSSCELISSGMVGISFTVLIQLHCTSHEALERAATKLKLTCPKSRPRGIPGIFQSKTTSEHARARAKSA
jgi:hypothetical protein